jgi:hypothetical protein
MPCVERDDTNRSIRYAFTVPQGEGKGGSALISILLFVLALTSLFVIIGLVAVATNLKNLRLRSPDIAELNPAFSLKNVLIEKHSPSMVGLGSKKFDSFLIKRKPRPEYLARGVSMRADNPLTENAVLKVIVDDFGSREGKGFGSRATPTVGIDVIGGSSPAINETNCDLNWFPYSKFRYLNCLNRDISRLAVTHGFPSLGKRLSHSFQLSLHGLRLLPHDFLLPFYNLPLPTINVGLDSNHQKHQETERIDRKELHALGQVGEEDTNKQQNEKQNPTTEKNSPQTYWQAYRADLKQRVVSIDALIYLGFFIYLAIYLRIFWHGLDLYFRKDNRNTK